MASGTVTTSNLAGVRLQQLAYLDAVGRTGHYADAADDLDVTQSALSQGLRRLEASLGSPLFERVGRGHRLTNAGDIALVFARRVLAEAQRVDEQLTAQRTGTVGTVRLGLVDAAALYLVRDELEAFRQQRPDVTLRLTVETSGRLLELLSQFAVDVAIVVGPAPNDAAVEIVREPLYVYGPEIDDLRDADQWVLYPEQSRTRRWIDPALAALGITPRASNESSNPSVIAQLVRLGEGWTVLPAGIAESISDPLPRRSEAIADRPLYAVRREHATQDPLVDDLITALTPPAG